MMSGEKREEALSRVRADANKFTLAQMTYRKKKNNLKIQIALGLTGINCRKHAKM